MSEREINETGNTLTILMALLLTVSIGLTFKMTVQGISWLSIFGQTGSWVAASVIEFAVFGKLRTVVEKGILNLERLNGEKGNFENLRGSPKNFQRIERSLKISFSLAIFGAAVMALLEFEFSFTPLFAFFFCTVPAWILLEFFLNGAIPLLSDLQSRENEIFLKMTETRKIPKPPTLLIKERKKSKIFRNSIVSLGFYTLFYLPVRFSSELGVFTVWNEKVLSALGGTIEEVEPVHREDEKKTFYSRHKILYYALPFFSSFSAAFFLLEFFYRNGLFATSMFSLLISVEFLILLLYFKDEKIFRRFSISLLGMLGPVAVTFVVSRFAGTVNTASTVVFVEVILLYELVMIMSKKRRREPMV